MSGGSHNKEIWKPIENIPYYLVSNLGRVKSIERLVKNNNYGGERIIPERILSPWKQSNDKNTYLKVTIGKKALFVHRLLCLAFIPNPNKFSDVNHKDGNKSNNNLENLEWCNRSYNNLHAYKNKLKFPIKGRKIAMIDKQNNNIIKVFESIADANNYMGLPRYSTSTINGCLSQRLKTAKGYKWEYFENLKEIL